MELDELKGQNLSGYHTEDNFIASRKYMGGRPVYHLDMSISQLTNGVDAPPVRTAQDDNRIVDEARGKLFRDYVNDNKDWASPSLLLWCPIGILTFNPIDAVNNLVKNPSSFLGILSIPRNSRQSIRILDGQHRILGFHMWMIRLRKELEAAGLHMNEAQRLGTPELIQEAQQRHANAKDNMSRSNKESIGIDILICESPREARQIFADIANNAKGMVKALAVGFDQTKLVNRVTSKLASDNPHPMLQDRVDFNKDRVSGNSNFMISAKTLADSIRSLSAGISGKISRAQEREANDQSLELKARAFFDAMQSAFSLDLALTPNDLRKKSLLGSGTIIRVLAGVWFELTSNTDSQGNRVNPRKTTAEATKFFETLAPHMQIPLKPGNGWLTTGVFPDPSKGALVTAPGSRNQELKQLVTEITKWATNPETFPFHKNK